MLPDFRKDRSVTNFIDVKERSTGLRGSNVLKSTSSLGLKLTKNSRRGLNLSQMNPGSQKFNI